MHGYYYLEIIHLAYTFSRARAGKLCRLVGSMFHFFFKIATSRGGNFDLDLHQDNSPGNK